VLADRPDHLDRRDTIVAATFIAIILQPDIDPLGESGGENAVLGIVELSAADGKADDFDTESLGGKFRKSAPAAADFQQCLLGPA
jgi:hypothetical protein